TSSRCARREKRGTAKFARTNRSAADVRYAPSACGAVSALRGSWRTTNWRGALRPAGSRRPALDLVARRTRGMRSPPVAHSFDPDRTRAAGVSNHPHSARHTLAHSSRQRRIECVGEERLALRPEWLDFWPSSVSAASVELSQGGYR